MKKKKKREYGKIREGSFTSPHRAGYFNDWLAIVLCFHKIIEHLKGALKYKKPWPLNEERMFFFFFSGRTVSVLEVKISHFKEKGTFCESCQIYWYFLCLKYLVWGHILKEKACENPRLGCILDLEKSLFMGCSFFFYFKTVLNYCEHSFRKVWKYCL